MYDIIIFGGGLSGLTLAHELIKSNLKILVVEKDHELGGMARSNIESNSLPSEHSWRGYPPFYKNTFQIMKEIPYYDSTVFDNLSIPIDFYLLYDRKYKYKSTTNIKDRIILAYLGGKYLMAGDRRDYYYTYNVEPFLKKHLSDDGYNYIINWTAGTGYGLEKHTLSMGHLFHFPIISYVHKGRHTSIHESCEGNIDPSCSRRWQVMNGPTSDVWIKPWVNYLKRRGVDILTDTELVKINHKNNVITSAEVKVGGIIQTLVSKEYILSINPYNSVDVLKNSNMTGLYNTFKSLTENTKSKQISFRIGIDKDIKYPVDNIGFLMNDSEYNITWYPQEKHWKKKPNIKSLWSGTIIDSVKKGKLFNKSAEKIDTDGLKEEIIYQILRSKSFQKLIYDNNGFHIKKEDIDYMEIWNEWSYIDGLQEQRNKKWINNIYNEQFRPSQKTKYENLYLSGAHTKTTINIWSMESAIESGKITANTILNKYNKPIIEYYKHNDPSYIKLFKHMDNILYKLHLPNIINFVILVILILVVLIIIYISKLLKKR